MRRCKYSAVGRQPVVGRSRCWLPSALPFGPALALSAQHFLKSRGLTDLQVDPGGDGQDGSRLFWSRFLRGGSGRVESGSGSDRRHRRVRESLRSVSSFLLGTALVTVGRADAAAGGAGRAGGQGGAAQQ